MILVSGATGNVGNELVKQLTKNGESVRVLVREESKAANWEGTIDVAVGDMEKPNTLREAMRGIEKLYFVTPETHQVKNLLEIAKPAGVRYVVKQSTIEADRFLGPGKWHREQELLIEKYGFDWCFLRPTKFMVNTVEWWAETVKQQSAVYFPKGKGNVPAVDPRDVAAAARTVLTQPGHERQIYELTGPQALSIREMVDLIARVLEKPVRYINVPALLAKIWMRRSSGLPDYVVNGLMETLGALRRNEYAYVSPDVERLTGLPPRDYESWLRENVEAFK
jgi:(4-alkanoyl-5-oxo-2,5-dihydrofuran-3-yl)methyl phosphate reductase